MKNFFTLFIRRLACRSFNVGRSFSIGGLIAITAIAFASHAQNSWIQKADFGGVPRQEASGFAIGNKIYIGTGWNGSSLSDFWEWDPATDVWTQKADFGGGIRQGAFHFSIGTKGYIGMGYLSGRKLLTLLDGNVAAGNTEVNLNRDQLSSGIYFIRISINGEVMVKKVVVE